jgi:hypothetical protein
LPVCLLQRSLVQAFVSSQLVGHLPPQLETTNRHANKTANRIHFTSLFIEYSFE